MDVIGIWSQVIGKEEGFGNPGERPTRNHNPGDLKPPGGKPNFWDGQTGVDAQGFAVFEDDLHGWAALHTDLRVAILRHAGATLQQFMGFYAPASDHNNPNAYAQLCATALGVPVTITLEQLGEMQNDLA